MYSVVKALFIVGCLTLLVSQSAEAASVCRSSAYEKKDAVSFCASKLNCPGKTPPQVMKCSGKPRRWICRCVAPAPTGGNQGGNSAVDIESRLQRFGRSPQSDNRGSSTDSGAYPNTEKRNSRINTPRRAITSPNPQQAPQAENPDRARPDLSSFRGQRDNPRTKLPTAPTEPESASPSSSTDAAVEQPPARPARAAQPGQPANRQVTPPANRPRNQWTPRGQAPRAGAGPAGPPDPVVKSEGAYFCSEGARKKAISILSAKWQEAKKSGDYIKANKALAKLQAAENAPVVECDLNGKRTYFGKGRSFGAAGRGMADILFGNPPNSTPPAAGQPPKPKPPLPAPRTGVVTVGGGLTPTPAPNVPAPSTPSFTTYDPVALPGHYCSEAEKVQKVREAEAELREMTANAKAANSWYDALVYGEGANTPDTRARGGDAKDAIREWENAQQLAQSVINTAKAIDVKGCDDKGALLRLDTPEYQDLRLQAEYDQSGADEIRSSDDGDKPIALGPYQPPKGGGMVSLPPLTPEQEELLATPDNSIESVIPELAGIGGPKLPEKLPEQPTPSPGGGTPAISDDTSSSGTDGTLSITPSYEFRLEAEYDRSGLDEEEAGAPPSDDGDDFVFVGPLPPDPTPDADGEEGPPLVGVPTEDNKDELDELIEDMLGTGKGETSTLLDIPAEESEPAETPKSPEPSRPEYTPQEGDGDIGVDIGTGLYSLPGEGAKALGGILLGDPPVVPGAPDDEGGVTEDEAKAIGDILLGGTSTSTPTTPTEPEPTDTAEPVPEELVGVPTEDNKDELDELIEDMLGTGKGETSTLLDIPVEESEPAETPKSPEPSRPEYTPQEGDGDIGADIGTGLYSIPGEGAKAIGDILLEDTSTSTPTTPTEPKSTDDPAGTEQTGTYMGSTIYFATQADKQAAIEVLSQTRNDIAGDQSIATTARNAYMYSMSPEATESQCQTWRSTLDRYDLEYAQRENAWRAASHRYMAVANAPVGTEIAYSAPALEPTIWSAQGVQIPNPLYPGNTPTTIAAGDTPIACPPPTITFSAGPTQYNPDGSPVSK